MFNLEDFDKDGELNNDINIDISDSEKLIYNLGNFVVNNDKKNYKNNNKQFIDSITIDYIGPICI